MQIDRTLLLAGALLGATGVALGAFGAHGLRATLGARELGWWETAVQYQMWHALALLALAALRLPRPSVPGLLIGLGTLVFSGSLYVMALTGALWLGMVTPIGGLAMIAGWAALASSGIRTAR